MSIKFSSLLRTSAPETEPVTLAEVRTQLKIEDDTEDTHLTLLMKAAREWAEDFLGRSIITQTWTAKFHGWSTDRVLALPRPPIATVTSVKYYNSAGTEVTLTVTTDYLLDVQAGEITLTEAFGFPALSPDRADPITIVYTAGYGAAAAVPSRIKQAILLAIANWYENRVPVVSGTIVSSVPMSCEYLLKQLRVRPV